MLVRIATRESRLALWQARHIAGLLEALHAEVETQLVPMTTSGDRRLEVTLSKIGGKGLFIKELEQAMLNGEADIAVHSMKDVPTDMPRGFILAAITQRYDPRDALVGKTLAELDAGARVGTSSLRRHAQMKLQRPDLEIAPVRGNVETRLGRLDDGDFDALLLAVAGLQRLGLEDRISEALDPGVSLPAIGQGAIGIECRSDSPVADLVSALDHTETRLAVTAERALCATLGASCTSPLAGFATVHESQIELHALLAHPDGSDSISAIASGADPHQVGQDAGERMLRHGAKAMLDEVADAWG